ncbi:stromal interaction molecule 1 [Echinococcus multilocularis]|uniref:Stromal interaction molecule 1 n=1 Tax=Echinococcus multilocularis TaxID=6211 RepID=A0A068Y1D6_ECHMU|nr:stromal interaction molecule 1 [Echinococcus multilocularis]
MLIYFQATLIFISIIEVCANANDVSRCHKKTLAFEAIADLHSQLDGDSSGGIDVSEASLFLGDKLSYPVDQFNQRDLSQEDGIISLLDLWVAWRKNPAHNWTVTETVRWLSEHVELPEYGDLFLQYKVDGESIPRLVSRNMKFLTDELGIKNSLHRRKLSLKAMDLILFGPPKKNLSTVAAASSLLVHLSKDMPLFSTLVVAIAFIITLIGLNRHYTQRLRSATFGNYDRLSRAEQTLQELQQELLGLKEAESSVCTNSRTATGRSVQIDDETLFHHSDSGRSSEHMSILSAKHSRTEPPTRKPSESSFFPRRTVAESQICSGQWSASPVLPAHASFYIGGSERISAASVAAAAALAAKRPIEAPITELALLLQMTHELELRHYWEKRSAAAKQLMAAKEACDRVRRKRSSLVGSVRLIHSDNLDDVDSKLNAARRVLENVTADMQERKHRWSRIEDLTGLILQQPADLNALLTALGYDKPRCHPCGEGNNNSIRLFDLSTDFSLFTGEDFVDDQPNLCTRPSDEECKKATLDWQNRSMFQDLPSKPRSDTPSTNDFQYPHSDTRNEPNAVPKENATGLLSHPSLPRNYSFVRPFAALWRRKAKSHQIQGCYSPPQSLSPVTPQFSLDPGSGHLNYDGYHRNPSIS